MQADEIRYKEDMKPLGLDWIELGLNSVLYDPKTRQIYTPNTNETANMERSAELTEKFPGQRRRPNGQFAPDSSGSGSGSGDSSGTGSDDSSDGELTGGGESGIIESKNKQAIKAAFTNGTTSDEIVEAIITNHKGLAEFTPSEMKDFLEENGYKTKPLGSRSSLKGIPFEAGGGYRVNFGNDGYFQYHPENKSHHERAYWKASCGKEGANRYDLDGNPF